VEDISPVSERSEESREDEKNRHHYWEHIHKLIESPIPICEINYRADLLEMIDDDDEGDDTTET
jgi:hypothetical protein